MQNQSFKKWYKENAVKLFWETHWYKYKLDEMNIFERIKHFSDLRKAREKAFEADDYKTAITIAPYYDKQAVMSKWWNLLNNQDKRLCLQYVYGNKGNGNLYGYDWWLPYFKDVGYFSNIDYPKPTEPFTLYRASAEPFALGMSWTADYDTALVFKEHSRQSFGKKYIYKLTATPDMILAIIEGDLSVAENQQEMTTFGAGTEIVLNHRMINFEDLEIIE